MALSYYYNFIVPTAANLRNPNEDDGRTPVDMEIKRGEFEPYTLKKSQLIVFVPRDLDGSGNKMLNFIITDMLNFNMKT